MAWRPPAAGELNRRIGIEVRGNAENVGGVVRDAWLRRHPEFWARIVARSGGNEFLADRLAGRSVIEVTLRGGPISRLTSTDDRLVEIHGLQRRFAIRDVQYPDPRLGWLVLLCEQEVSDD